ncbi:hypothetical protein J1605_008312 [Eschrichtius robustus]|uniref:Uncharacterized protein n=1 Tax=Eschrichtius robustus TaxID=9764 RepID=A0AB34GY72_ESCRO|nr:hypothetical protein J1605_008312 [Eschrichtius robustus]
MRRGEDGGTSRSGERWKEGAARTLRPTAIRESPGPCARARTSPRLRRREAGGAAGGAGGAIGGRSEGWEGAREPAGGRGASPPASAAAAFARRLTDGPIVWRTGLGARLVLGASSSEAGGLQHALPRPLAATPAPAASAREGLEVREPLSAGRSLRCSAPAAALRRGPRAASLSPSSPTCCSEQRCSGAPNSGCRGKCLHEPRGCPGSITRVLKSVVASNISYLASMSYFGPSGACRSTERHLPSAFSACALER